MRHYSVGESGLRREMGKLNQLENHFALTLGFNAAEGAVCKVHRSGGGKQALRPELDFVSSEVHS